MAVVSDWAVGRLGADTLRSEVTVAATRNAHSTFRLIGLATLAAAVSLLLAVPAAAIPPAAKEYSLQFPNAKGKSQTGADRPEAVPLELPLTTRRQLERSSHGKTLATIATASELGAPELAPVPVDRGTARSRQAPIPSVTSALGVALGDPVAIVLLAGLGAVLLAGLALRRGREGG